MIGFFDYTVWLTYASLLSAVVGIYVSFSGGGHPFIATVFLLFSGLCDAFDGKVARTKPNRTQMERNYGIQIDSLADLVAFGVLPTCIGDALYRVSTHLPDSLMTCIPHPVYVGIFCIYILAALVRLAYFNVTEEENQAKGQLVRKVYTGLPVTSSALIFPTFFADQLFAAARHRHRLFRRHAADRVPVRQQNQRAQARLPRNYDHGRLRRN